MQLTPEIKATIREALGVHRSLLTMSAAWDEHRGQQVVAINTALQWLDTPAPQPTTKEDDHAAQ